MIGQRTPAAELPIPVPANRLFAGISLKALVTGGAGFIGHHLVRSLVDRGDEVTVIDDFSTGRRSRLEPFRDQISVVAASILDPSALDRAAAGVEVVFHEAAIPSVARSLVAPMATNQANVNGTIEVMLAAARTGVRRVVFAGPPPCTEGKRSCRPARA